MHNSGVKIFNIYIFFWYLVPLFLAFLFPVILSEEYRYGVDIKKVVAVLIIFYFFYLISFKIQNSFNLFKDLYIPKVNPLDNIIFQSIKSLIILFVAIGFLIFAGSSYRHQIQLSSLGSIGYIFLFVTSWLKTEIIFDFVRFLQGHYLNTSLNLLKFFGVLVPLMMFTSHAFDIFFVVAGFFAYLNIRFLKKLLNMDLIKLSIIYLPFSLVLIFLVLFVGFGNKVGYDFFLQNITNPEYILYVFQYIVWRISISIAAIQSTLEVFYMQAAAFDVLEINFRNSLSRLSTLFQINYDRHEVGTINRLNFMHLFSDNSSLSSGTSPGLIAGLMLTQNPFLIIFYIFFSTFILNMFGVFIPKESNFISPFILMTFFAFIFDNPLGLFVFPEVSSISIVLFLFFYLCYVHRKFYIKS